MIGPQLRLTAPMTHLSLKNRNLEDDDPRFPGDTIEIGSIQPDLQSDQL